MNNEGTVYTADAVVIDSDRQVLLIFRGWHTFEGVWALPGGYVDPVVQGSPVNRNVELGSFFPA